jgi:cysteine desulfurase/selenocysteine lyase
LDGYTVPAKEIIKIAHDYGALVMLDGAQSTPSQVIDVQKLDVDFFAFSSHKMLGPTGFGILYGKSCELEKLSPFLVGGNSVESSTYESSVLLDLPERFEAGLQDYAGAIGAAAAVDYISKIGKDNIIRHEYELNRLITDNLKDISGFDIIGPQDPKLRGGIFSFNISDVEPHNVTMFLDEANIMSRSGVFCVHSWFNAHNIQGAVRISLYLYNTVEECKIFVEKVNELM